MSFAAGVRQELCRQAVGRRCCAVAEAFGVLLYANAFTPDTVRVVTENADFAARLPRIFRRAFGLGFDAVPEEGGRTGKLIFTISDQEKIARIFEAFGFSAAQHISLHVNFGILEEECCRVSFLRGAFLAGGSVTDPAKRYHLELSTAHRKVGGETEALLLDLGFRPKALSRGGVSILYFKQSDAIEDLLTLLGAPVAAMAVMEAKVEKELRNGVNRRVNCDTANLTKVVDAAQEQIAAIRRLERRGALAELPDKLRATAALRLENPEATLAELAEMQDPPVSKSAMNHRLRKLLELAGKAP
ncbi:MAG: DNA-binding protein WhiA [Oscillospiraceae bacterium]|nr:DNA-binding protein WhiA [Oscillospiraceae bacterium]